ncbi:MAG: adhesin [Candidatus Binatia bacterium]|nr:MAG: adhesin [Candidatus Binatia bacterium]
MRVEHSKLKSGIFNKVRQWHHSAGHTIPAVLLVLAIASSAARAEETLKVVTTLPDFASIARHVGGERVDVVSLAQGGEDPHFLEAKPSFVKLLASADVVIVAGMDLELGYLPLLLQNARNGKILPGQVGYVDCSTVVEKLQVPTAPVDRSMGDVHPYGNPHYWLDPINGVAIAARLAEVFSQIQPVERAGFEHRAKKFQDSVYARLAGEELARKYDVSKLATLQNRGQLLSFLESQGDARNLSGWWGALLPKAPIKAVDDHNMWPYFARRFGIEIVGHMEPKPGIPPTTAQLQLLVKTMEAQRVHLIFSSPYYDPRHARFLAEATGAVIVPLAHLTGSRPGTADYLDMVDYNVRTLRRALEETETSRAGRSTP